MSEKKIFKTANYDLEYVEENRGAKKLVILLHGYGANMRDLFDLNHYLDFEENFDFIFPNGILSIDMGMHYDARAWFPINMQELERHMRMGSFRDFSEVKPEGLNDSLNVLKTFITELFNQYDEIVLGGFSQGAMLTSLLIKEFDTKINKAIFFSGNLIAKDLLGDNYSHLSFIQSHGELDQVLGINGAKLLYTDLSGKGASGEFYSFRGGHEIPMEVIEKTKEFLKK